MENTQQNVLKVPSASSKPRIILIGVISALMSTLFFALGSHLSSRGGTPAYYEFITFLPGAVFGIALVMYASLFNQKRASLGQALMVIFLSAISYFVAFSVAVILFFPLFGVGSAFVAGSIGALILTPMLPFVVPFPVTQKGRFITSGGLFGLLGSAPIVLLFLDGPFDGSPDNDGLLTLSFLFLFLVWQIGMLHTIRS